MAAHLRITTGGGGIRLDVVGETNADGAADGDAPRQPPLRPSTIPGKVWSDGTPIWYGDRFLEPWGADPRDRWVRVYADICASGVWDVSGGGGGGEDLPISAALVVRIDAWQDWHDRLDSEYSKRHTEPHLHFWEQHPDAPLDALNAEGEAIAQALRAELPSDWTVVYAALQNSYG